MNAKRWLAVVAAIGLFLFSSAFSLVSSVINGSWQDLWQIEDTFVERVVESGNGRGKIATIYLNGVIESGYDTSSIFESAGYNHRELLHQLDYAAKDGEVYGIIIRVNTPGGGVVESSEIHDKIVEIIEEYRKPVYISMGSMAASGGYYIAAPATKIYANPQTITGSIGVIMQSINVGELASELGIESQVIKSGEYKDIMSSFREMTTEEKQILQEMIDESYEQFVDVIEAGRNNLSREDIYELADGRIYSGQQAYDAGLIDGVGHLDDVIDALLEELDRGKLDVIEYDAGFGFPSLFSLAAQRLIGGEHQLFGVTEWFQRNQGPKMMYLYTD
ncbi:protease-4 [Evansella caseinilytica]|uniref:Protease-4 n=1 Tax=Evansella caseinilytica TaxID=1503961 RepID=A0A1H3RSL5_9BACI|nr:signal peptide peptidase SppA [Evansella caseinilytica]SDZ28191.1 protease-4 [Evansella caseinilytica]